jgi:hypothetical protein
MSAASKDAELEALRKRAKRWLKAIRSGDAAALADFERWFPGRKTPGLREVQQALAREHGHASWSALKEDIEARTLGETELIDEFLKHACLSYGADDWPSKWRRAERLRARRARSARARRPAPANGLGTARRESGGCAVLCGAKSKLRSMQLQAAT